MLPFMDAYTLLVRTQPAVGRTLSLVYAYASGVRRRAVTGRRVGAVKKGSAVSPSRDGRGCRYVSGMWIDKDAVLAISVIAVHLLVCNATIPWAGYQRQLKTDAADQAANRLFDNVRFFCEIQVVFSHYVLFLAHQIPTGGSDFVWPRSSLLDSASSDLAWPQIVYESTMVYRISCFAFLCGLSSKGELNAARAERLLIYNVVPIFLYLRGPIGCIFGCGRFDLNLIMTDQIDALWFLSAIIIWRLSAVLLRSFSAPIIVVLGVAISAFGPSVFEHGPYAADNALSYKMAITFFAPFALGLAFELRGPQLRVVDSWRYRGLGIAGLLGITLAFASSSFVAAIDTHCANLYTMDDNFTSVVFDYVGLPEGSIENPNALRISLIYAKHWAWVPRLSSMTLALVLSVLTFLALPQHATWFSDAGKLNAYPYMLHMLVLMPLHELAASVLPFKKLSRKEGSPHYLEDPWLEVLVWWPYLTLAPLLLTFMLSSKPVRLLTWPVVEPTWFKLFLKGSWERYTANSCAQLHTLAPAHLGFRAREDIITWAMWEALAVTAIAFVNHLAPTHSTKILAAAAGTVGAWQAIDRIYGNAKLPHKLKTH